MVRQVARTYDVRVVLSYIVFTSLVVCNVWVLALHWKQPSSTHTDYLIFSFLSQASHKEHHVNSTNMQHDCISPALPLHVVLVFTTTCRSQRFLSMSSLRGQQLWHFVRVCPFFTCRESLLTCNGSCEDLLSQVWHFITLLVDLEHVSSFKNVRFL